MDYALGFLFLWSEHGDNDAKNGSMYGWSNSGKVKESERK